MGLCETLLAQKQSLSQQLEDLDTDAANQWLACLVADTFPGGPAASQSANDVQLRIDQLVQYMFAPSPAALNAILAYQAFLTTVQHRMQVQNTLNMVVIQLIQNGCPLE